MFRGGTGAAVRDGRDRPLPRRKVHFALENDGWNCTLECEVHVSASGAPAAASARTAAHLPDRPTAAQVVRICCKGPDRAGAREKNR